MKKLFLLTPCKILITLYLFTSSSAYAENCNMALNNITTILKTIDKALVSKDFDQMSEITESLKMDAQAIINASDQCACDTAYYSAEKMFEDADGAYLAEDFNEAITFVKALKIHTELVKTQLKVCQ